MVQRGEAATLEEARSALARKGALAAAQKLVDRGEASTLEEAWSELGSRARRVALQNLVDAGEAATLKEARALQLGRMRDAKRAQYGQSPQRTIFWHH